jgi:hypothetical protein
MLFRNPKMGFRNRVAVIGAAALVWIALIALVLGRMGGDTGPVQHVAAATNIAAPAFDPPEAPTADVAVPESPAPSVVIKAARSRAHRSVVSEPVQEAAAVAAAVVDQRLESTPEDQLIFDGQSFNYAQRSNGRSYPAQLVARLGSRIGLSSVLAMSGTTYAQRSGSVGARVDTQYRKAKRSTVLDLAGQSDILAGVTGAQLYKAVSAYADARRRAGARFIIEYTITPSDSRWYTKAEDTERQTYNRLLLADAQNHFDAVIDLASRPEFAHPEDTTYFEDGLHPTEQGAAVIASLAEVAVRALLR